MKKCKACRTEIDLKATKCPHCQADQRGWFKRHPFLTVIGLIVLFVIFASSSSVNKNQNESTSKSKSETVPSPNTTIAITQSQIPIETPIVSTPVQKVSITVTPVIKFTPTVEVQQTGANLLPSREDAKSIVKAAAESKWADDYEMVKYTIDNQMEAYDWLARQNTHLDILKRAKQKWADDYEMVKYEYENQVEAFESL